MGVGLRVVNVGILVVGVWDFFYKIFDKGGIRLLLRP